jgi:hypothetical protein
MVGDGREVIRSAGSHGRHCRRLEDSLVCLSTFAIDASLCAGAITVAREPSLFADDPFARLFGGTVVETGLFSAVEPPSGPVIERYAGAPWPGGRFG